MSQTRAPLRACCNPNETRRIAGTLKRATADIRSENIGSPQPSEAVSDSHTRLKERP
jgi:hypothetical protein